MADPSIAQLKLQAPTCVETARYPEVALWISMQLMSRHLCTPILALGTDCFKKVPGLY